jgi:hypothetical protein
MSGSVIDETLSQYHVFNADGEPVKTTDTVVKPTGFIFGGISKIINQINALPARTASFLKGDIAAGKSSTLLFLANTCGNVLSMNADGYKTQEEFDGALKKLILKKWPHDSDSDNPSPSLVELLEKHVPENALICIDEAHIAFALHTDILVAHKGNQLQCRVLFVSATKESSVPSKVAASPKSLDDSTFNGQWSLTSEECVALVEAVWTKTWVRPVGAIEDKHLKADAEAFAKFLLPITSGHRGLFSELLAATLTHTIPHSSAITLSSAIEGVNSRLRGYGLTCRAAKPNLVFDNFVQNYRGSQRLMAEVLSHGKVTYDGSEQQRHCLTIGALSTTARMLVSRESVLTFPNVFYARCVRFHSQFTESVVVEQPTHIHDLLVYGITYFNFEQLFSSAPNTTSWWTRRQPPSPYELQLDQAITGGIQNAMGWTAQTGYSSTTKTEEGMPDAVFQNYVLEYVVAGIANAKSLQEHFDRFTVCPAYQRTVGGNIREQLLVVFGDGTLPSRWIRGDDANATPASIAMISFSESTFWRFRVVFCEATPTAICSDRNDSRYTHTLQWTTFSGDAVPVDFVARRVERNATERTFRLKSAQSLQVKKRHRRTEVRVYQRTGSGSSFSVTPTADDIDHLKKAIAPDMNPRQQAAITIYAPDEAHGDVAVVLPSGATKKYKKVIDSREPLMRNDGKDDPPYLFELPAEQ